jgi:hypothetical protein
MSDLNLYIKLSALSNPLKEEILDYMDFLISRRSKKKNGLDKHPQAGCMKGTFKMSPDFDEPLDDFKEYNV